MGRRSDTAKDLAIALIPRMAGRRSAKVMGQDLAGVYRVIYEELRRIEDEEYAQVPPVNPPAPERPQRAKPYRPGILTSTNGKGAVRPRVDKPV